ncbi:MAG: hypothetical protein HQL85_19630 [Magnetococcales bacterium]|nr:hypothetical protein [Magnetococcales bacterium]
MNATDPICMTAEERLAEAAAIVATGIIRMKEKQKAEKIPLDKLPDQCLNGRKTTKGERP